MTEANMKENELAAEVRVVVEVDGKPVGFLNLDVDRLWPLINHRQSETMPVEWIDAKRYDAVLRATVVKQLLARLAGNLYNALGAEIVKAELDAESFALKADSAVQGLGCTTGDIEKLVSESNRTPQDFYNFFWDYMIDDREVADLKKEWKAAIRS
jgi:hypothetical protein